MKTSIQFLGAAETVTGSRYLIETARARVLVDCGLFQGWKRLRERNWDKLPFDPASLDAVVLTHAHIDHTGYLPRLAQLGFKGPAYCTSGTTELLRILLPDAGHLQEEEARYANRRGYSKHRPAKPLYTREDAENCLSLLEPKPFYERFEVASGVSARFSRAGHIVGSACLELDVGGRKLAFTGDAGRPADPIMKPPDGLPNCDVLITESTYGDRRHADDRIDLSLQRIISETTDRGGVILVPSFAVGRAQHLLHLVAALKAERRISDLPVYLDSPMAIDATDIFCRHKDDHRLTEDECRAMCRVASYSRTPDDSKAIDRRTDSMMVISASGMATGGRILHHLEQFLPDERNTVLFVGFQAAGTRGRSMVDGADEIKLHGQYVPVRAKVAQLPGLSAHADYGEMLDWLRSSAIRPSRVFVTHGEPAAADAFRRRLRDSFGWDVDVPSDGERQTLV